MRLKSFINEGINDKGILKACFILGIPGSGKSYTITKIKSGQIETRVVNIDKVFHLFGVEKWTEWQGIKDKVKKLNKTQLANYLNSLLPLAIDGTGSHPSVIFRRYGLLESLGYDMAGIFINTDLETAMQRASKRERPVDPEFIEESYRKINQAKSFYKTKFRNWKEIDNSEGELTNEVIIKSFNFMNNFYNSKLLNPVGIGMVEEMIENGWKYMSDGVREVAEIKTILDAWYKM